MIFAYFIFIFSWIYHQLLCKSIWKKYYMSFLARITEVHIFEFQNTQRPERCQDVVYIFYSILMFAWKILFYQTKNFAGRKQKILNAHIWTVYNNREFAKNEIKKGKFGRVLSAFSVISIHHKLKLWDIFMYFMCNFDLICYAFELS